MPAYPPSATSWSVLVVGVAAPGTAERVASHVVPEGMAIVVTARLNNSQVMYIAESQTNAQTATARKRLEPGQSTTLYLDNTNKIWVDADSANDRLEIVPQKIPSTGG
jgi:hypothetical protein